MKKQIIVYHANGENAGTYGALCFLENFTGNLDEKVSKFRSYDDDHNFVEVDRYFVREEQLPDWMNELDYRRYETKMKFAVALAGKWVLDLPFEEFDRFISLPETQKFWYGWARKSKSLFLQSMVFQFEQWLAGKTKFQTPLSSKQWDAAMKYCPVYKARQISTKLYYSRSF